MIPRAWLHAPMMVFAAFLPLFHVRLWKERGRRWPLLLPSCFCCGCSLRAGALFSAVVSGAYSLLLAAAPWTLGVCGHRLCKALDGGLATQLGAWIAAALLVLASVLMAVGAKTGRRELLLPWLLFGAAYVGLWLAGGVVALALVWMQGAPLLAAAAFFVALNMAVLPVYFLATVAALYLQIREQERAAAERALAGASPAPSPSAPAPTL